MKVQDIWSNLLEAPDDSFLAVANSPVVEVAYNRVVSRPAVDRVSLSDTGTVEVLTDDAIVALTALESVLPPATDYLVRAAVA